MSDATTTLDAEGPTKEAPSKTTGRNYSAFDNELTHQALNLHLFGRLLGWMRPYRITVLVSIVLVIIAATGSVLMPVMTGRVIIDTILLPNAEASSLPDYGLIAATEGLTSTFGIAPLTAAGLIYIGLVLAQAP